MSHSQMHFGKMKKFDKNGRSIKKKKTPEMPMFGGTRDRVKKLSILKK